MSRRNLIILLRLAALATLLGLTGAITFGYLGWLHPAFDSFSHFRIHLAVLTLLGVLLLLLLRFWPEAIFATFLGVVTIVQTTGLPFSSGLSAVEAQAGQGQVGQGQEAVYSLLHANLRYNNPEPERALSLIGQLRPDVVSLVEVSAFWRQKLTALESAYPYRLICDRPSHIGGAAILSRRPFVHGSQPACGDRGSFAHAMIDFGGNSVEVVTMHLGWPWPFEQPWQLPHVMPLLRQIGPTAIIAGDLNAVPWSQTAQQVAAAAGSAQILRGIGPTWLNRRLPDWMRPLIGLPIDNIMVKGGITPVALGATQESGSDHLPVLLQFRLSPQVHERLVMQALAG